jgi:hypothetical protein
VNRLARAAPIVVLLLTGASMVGCSAPSLSLKDCSDAPPPVVQAIALRLTAPGSLRNAQTITAPSSDVTFVSAELHLRSDKSDAKGDILTWAVPGATAAPGDFVSVDEHARKDSSWPQASFDVRRDGAIRSRACTDQYLGNPPTTLNPACQGGGAAVPGVQLQKPKGCK